MSKLQEHLNEKKLINPALTSPANMQQMEDGYYGAYDGVAKLVSSLHLYKKLGGNPEMDKELKLWVQIEKLINNSGLGKEL
jgi:hypothetical protein